MDLFGETRGREERTSMISQRFRKTCSFFWINFHLEANSRDRGASVGEGRGRTMTELWDSNERRHRGSIRTKKKEKGDILEAKAKQ